MITLNSYFKNILCIVGKFPFIIFRNANKTSMAVEGTFFDISDINLNLLKHPEV